MQYIVGLLGIFLSHTEEGVAGSYAFTPRRVPGCHIQSFCCLKGPPASWVCRSGRTSLLKPDCSATTFSCVCWHLSHQDNLFADVLKSCKIHDLISTVIDL